ncbi:glycoside hydrolase family 28 protein [Sodiomyces alcalophilus JCM 7366]|uniref:glycoside hydrolase family 28 protein n=1 Tax=Sodiomyces alcalophilus JCM 7366 TaxID=591952 RepID=UPI0039B4CB3F
MFGLSTAGLPGNQLMGLGPHQTGSGSSLDQGPLSIQRLSVLSTFRKFYTANDGRSILLDLLPFQYQPGDVPRHQPKINVTNVSSSARQLSEQYRGHVTTCRNIRFMRFNFTSPYGREPVVVCDGLKGDLVTWAFPFPWTSRRRTLLLSTTFVGEGNLRREFGDDRVNQSNITFWDITSFHWPIANVPCDRARPTFGAITTITNSAMSTDAEDVPKLRHHTALSDLTSFLRTRSFRAKIWLQRMRASRLTVLIGFEVPGKTD